MEQCTLPQGSKQLQLWWLNPEKLSFKIDEEMGHWIKVQAKASNDNQAKTPENT